MELWQLLSTLKEEIKKLPWPCNVDVECARYICVLV